MKTPFILLGVRGFHVRRQTGLSQKQTKETKETKVFPSLSSFPSVKCFFVLSFSLFVLHCNAQIQQAWVARYNNGVPSGRHQALKVALDSAGSALVCGFSQNTNGGTGYALVKCAPNGTVLWVSRFDPTNVSQAKPAAFALDPGGDAVATGNAGTVRINNSGTQAWAAPYAGLSVAVDSSSNVFVTGFGTNFNTVKINPAGSNLWTSTYKDFGPTIGQAVVVDGAGNAYIVGPDTWMYRGGPHPLDHEAHNLR